MSKNQPVIVIFGAGNIGRGFIGQLFSQAHYAVIFIDAAEALVQSLNEEGEYPIQLVSEEGNQSVQVGPVRALLISDQAAVNEAVLKADIMATAVGVPILRFVAGPVAKALTYRRTSGNTNPVDILVCENKLDAGHYLKELIAAADPSLLAMLAEDVGFVETSIGRMVPVLSPEERKDNPLLVRTEPYYELPVDADGFKGAVPQIPSMKPFSPFHFYHQRKLYIHNMGHALTAYLGWLIGCETVAEAIAVPDILTAVEQAMRQVGQALSRKYGVAESDIEEHIQDLLHRFANRQLGDTVARVGRDPMRKLAPDDRLVGSLLFSLEQGIEPFNIAAGIAAALLFAPDDDPAAKELAKRIAEQGADQVLRTFCGIDGSEELDHWRRAIISQNLLLKIMRNKRG